MLNCQRVTHDNLMFLWSPRMTLTDAFSGPDYGTPRDVVPEAMTVKVGTLAEMKFLTHEAQPGKGKGWDMEVFGILDEGL